MSVVESIIATASWVLILSMLGALVFICIFGVHDEDDKDKK